MSDASSDLGGSRAGPVERDIEQVPPLLPSHHIHAGLGATRQRPSTMATNLYSRHKWH
jgi:hypothetical protein